MTVLQKTIGWLTVFHVLTLVAGVVLCMRGDAGVGALLLCVAVLLLILVRVDDIVGRDG